ncbi:MAG: DUF4918 family protein [Filimonas sp.]|nr:DUF4918 family protein [Filimonas sp.]
MLVDKILPFLFHLKMPFTLPAGVGVLDAYADETIKEIASTFYKKFYNDNHKRHLLVGINPGRFGGGITGIPFTDPIRLKINCGIENSFPAKQELSSVFMYEMIEAYGGAKAFYHDYYITAVSPLGFVKNGKNLNYYDDKALLKDITPFVIDCMEKQLSWGIKTDVCFCIGEGENVKYLRKLNDEHKWFDRVEALPHPRFIMQYKLKQKSEYVSRYVELLHG